MSRNRCAFTLIELLLVVAILVVLIGAIGFGLSSWSRSRDVDGAMTQLTTALRMARVEAMNRGKRIRLEFREDEAGLTLLIESDPIGAPGTFTPHTGCAWAYRLDDDRLVPVTCRRVGDSALVPLDSASLDEADEPIQPIQFYPDGTCDSVEIHLRPLAPSDTRHVFITVHGPDATIAASIYSQEEADELGLLEDEE